MRYIIREIYYFFIKIYFSIRFRNIRIGFRAKVDPHSFFHGYNSIEHHSFFSGEIGRCSYIGENSHIIGKIGSYCSIAGNVNFVTLTHPVEQYVSTSPCFYSTRKQCGMSYVKMDSFNENPTLDGLKHSITVGNDVYIGFGATIIGPVRIGDGSVIAANATVTKDVEPYSIVGGVPARIIRYRFTKDIIEKLKERQWWNNDTEWILKNVDFFSNIDEFIINMYDKNNN